MNSQLTAVLDITKREYEMPQQTGYSERRPLECKQTIESLLNELEKNLMV